MCSYVTEKTNIAGSGKGPEGWFRLNAATVYFDHPYHAPYEHTLNIDFVDNTAGPGARVAVELSAESARELVRCIESALAAAGPAAGTGLAAAGPAAGTGLAAAASEPGSA